MEKMRNLHFRQ